MGEHKDGWAGNPGTRGPVAAPAKESAMKRFRWGSLAVVAVVTLVLAAPGEAGQSTIKFGIGHPPTHSFV